MSIFVAKMLTIMGFVFFAGGPADAVKMAVLGAPEADVPAITCASCEKVAIVDISQAQSASQAQSGLSLRPAVGGAFWNMNSMEYDETGDGVIVQEMHDDVAASQGMK